MEIIRHTFAIIILSLTAGIANAQDSLKTTADSILLKEVVVTQKFIRHEAGKDIVNTLTLRKGKTNLVELLNDVPGLMVNENDESVQILGKGGIKVMLNGRLKNIPAADLYNFLRSRSASNVTAIEIVKVPGAKYDASGNFGILNIITERRQNFLGGDLGEEVSYGKKWSNSLRANLNYSQKRVEANLAADWDIRNDKQKESNTSYFSDLSRESSMTNYPRRRDYSLSGMTDYHIDSLSVFSLDVSYSHTYRKANATTDFRSFDHSLTPLEDGVTTSNTRTPRRNLNVNFYIDRNWSEDNSIKFSLDLFNYKYTNDYDYRSLIVSSQEGTQATDYFVNHGTSALRGLSGTLDYATMLPLGISLSTGLKAHVTTTKNAMAYDMSAVGLQNDYFTYDENVYAAYLVVSRKVENWDFRLGGRYEQTYTKSQSASSDTYGRFFPDMIVSYSFKGGSSLELSVNSGTERPGIRHINPFSFYINPYNVTVGNPTIRPNNWWSVKLTHNWSFNGGELSTDLSYMEDNGVFDQTTKMDNTTTVATTQWSNAYDDRSCFLDMSLYYYKIKWLKITSGLELAANKSIPKIEFISDTKKYFEQTFYCNLRFILDARNAWSAYLNTTFSGKEKKAIGTFNPMFNLNCGMNYSLLKNKLNLKLSLRNIFASKVSGTSYSNDNMHMTFSNRYNNLNILVGASYSFGHDLRINRKKHSSAEIESRFE